MTSILIEKSSVTFTNNTTATVQRAGFPTVGTILCWAGNNMQNLDTDYLICEGGQYSKSIYPELFNVIGNRYGGTDPLFKVPDFRNKMPAGSQSANVMQLDGISGHNGGSVQLEAKHFPHTHTMSPVYINYATEFNVATWNGGTKRSVGFDTAQFLKDSTNPIADSATMATANVQTGTLPPYTIFTFIIKAKP